MLQPCVMMLNCLVQHSGAGGLGAGFFGLAAEAMQARLDRAGTVGAFGACQMFFAVHVAVTCATVLVVCCCCSPKTLVPAVCLGALLE